MVLAGCGTDDFSAAPVPPPAKPLEGPKAEPNSIRGRATIHLRGQGWDQVLGGMELSLVPAEFKANIIEVRDRRWRERAVNFNFSDGVRNLDLVAIGLEVKERRKMDVKADSDGFYIFKKVPAGKYVLYGQYKSRYAMGYWLIDVEMTEGASPKIDIYNDNMAEAFNLVQQK